MHDFILELPACQKDTGMNSRGRNISPSYEDPKYPCIYHSLNYIECAVTVFSRPITAYDGII